MNFNNDMTNDGMIFEAHKQIVKPLSHVCYHIWRASVRSERKSACVRTVRWSLYTILSACTLVFLVVVKKDTSNNEVAARMPNPPRLVGNFFLVQSSARSDLGQFLTDPSRVCL